MTRRNHTLSLQILTALLLLSVLLSACGPVATPAVTPMPFASSTVTPTPTTSSTPTRTATRTRIFIPTLTDTPVPPTSTPFPAVALTSPGPWIVMEQSVKKSNKKEYYGYLAAMSEDGKEWTALDLPVIDESTYMWEYRPAPHGGYIAVRANPTTRSFLEKNNLDGWIYLVKLPENRIVRKIPFIGDAAWALIETGKANPEGFSLSRLTTERGSLVWSPDGRYLAYTAAIETAQAEVFLYDTQEDSIRPFAKEEGHTIPWSWSPDSQILLVQELAHYDENGMGLIISDFKAMYSVSLDGTKKLLYPAQRMEAPLWLDENRLLVYEIGLEGYTCNLRELDFRSGNMKLIEKECFSSVSLSQKKREILLGLSTNVYLDFGKDSGIYRVNLDTLQRTRLITCAFCGARWQKTLLYVDIGLEEDGEMVLLDASGKEIKRVTGRFTALYRSLDGKWIVDPMNEHPKLMNASFEIVKEMPMNWSQKPLWRSDSTGFFTTVSGSIVFYGQENDWQPVTIRPVEAKTFEWVTVQP